jgi:hypothetical protein
MKVTKRFLEDHKYYALMDAFILTGNTLKILLKKTETPINWLAVKLEANEKLFLELFELKDTPLSRILTISILDALKDRFDTRGKIKKIHV